MVIRVRFRNEMAILEGGGSAALVIVSLEVAHLSLRELLNFVTEGVCNEIDSAVPSFRTQSSHVCRCVVDRDSL